MNVNPSYKISMTVAAIYAIVLFIPTIDVLAIRSLDLLGMQILYNLAVFIFPACYTLSDSVTEVYGKKVSYYLAISSYVVVVLFSFFNNFLVSVSINSKLYSFLLQPSLTLTVLGPIGYFTTAFINIKLLSRLKAKMRGRHFIFRSFICSGISEVIISLIIYPAIFYEKGAKYILSVASGTTLIKILITIPFVFVAKFVVLFFKYMDNIDVSPYNKNLSILSIKNSTNTEVKA